MTRTFAIKPGKRGGLPVLIGITGPSSSGKTFSALRLAVGMQRVTGGGLTVIDTEGERALQYADLFKFDYIKFTAPFGPLDYLAAIEDAVKDGAKNIVVDSMTHEHNGEGGVMDQSDTFLNDRCGDDYTKRKKQFMLSLVKPKGERKKLNSRIVQLGINAVFCYRAQEKFKPAKGGGEPEDHGWQPETTSPLHYDMMARFLLPPGSDGYPIIKSDNKYERLHTKNPEQFRGWWANGMQLTEDVGERMANWASGVFRLPSGEHKDKAITDPTVPPDYLEKLLGWDKASAILRREVEAELKRRKGTFSEPVEPPPEEASSTAVSDGPDVDAGEMSEAEQQEMKLKEEEPNQ